MFHLVGTQERHSNSTVIHLLNGQRTLEANSPGTVTAHVGETVQTTFPLAQPIVATATQLRPRIITSIISAQRLTICPLPQPTVVTVTPSCPSTITSIVSAQRLTCPLPQPMVVTVTPACPDVITSASVVVPVATNSSQKQETVCSTSAVAVLGVLAAVLAILLAVAIMGWVYTYMKRPSLLNQKVC